jgi:hypothetical protein
VLTLALAAAVGLSAYWTALASKPAEADPPMPAPQPVPGLLPLGAGAKPGLSAAARDRAWVRGRRAGFREGQRAAARKLRRRLGGFATWTPGAAYIVTSAPDGKGIRTRVGPLKSTARYGLCHGGRAVCVTPPD